MFAFTGYTQALRPGVKLGLGLAIDTQKLNEVSPSGPAHKVSVLRSKGIVIVEADV